MARLVGSSEASLTTTLAGPGWASSAYAIRTRWLSLICPVPIGSLDSAAIGPLPRIALSHSPVS